MPTNNQKTKYALYCRKSTEDSSRQILSLDSQEEEMKRMAINLGLDIVLVYKESKSAKMPNNRPLFSQLVKLVEKGEIDGILCWKIDRLSRNPIDSATIQWLLQQEQLKVIQTMERQYLPSDNALLFNVESGMANQYIRDLSKNVKRGIRAKLEKGYWPNMAPIGYLNKDNKIVVDSKRSKYIKRAFELYLTENYSIKEVAEILFKEGFRSRSGNKYHKSKIHKMLGNSFYCGIMVQDGQKYLGKYRPIVSKKLFDDVQRIREQNMRPKKQNTPFAFRGILRCATCGCQLTATKKKGRLVYYYCTNGKGICDEHKAYLKEESISLELLKAFDSLNFDEKVVDLVYRAKLEENASQTSYLDASVVSLQDNLERLSKRKSALLDGFLDGVVSESDYKSRLQDINNEIVLVNKDLKEIKEQKERYSAFTLEQIKNKFLEPKQRQKEFLALNSEKQREVIISILWNATIKNKKIANISYKEPFDVLSKIENKSDFDSVRGVRDSIHTEICEDANKS